MIKRLKRGISQPPLSHGRPCHSPDLAITHALVIKRVFRLTLRAARGGIDSILPEWAFCYAARMITVSAVG